jgi:hypothetical protein
MLRGAQHDTREGLSHGMTWRQTLYMKMFRRIFTGFSGHEIKLLHIQHMC